jgi:hypothetical protein
MARGTGSKDRTAPVVTITSPANGTLYTTAGTITITATATDNKAVARVEFQVTNNSTGAVGALATDTTAPYSATWPVPVQLGNYTITAKAVDTSGNFSTHSIVVTRTDSTTTTTTSTTIAPPPTLPASKILATPTAWYQGGEGSCCSMSATLTRSIEEYYTTGATSYSQSTNILSPEWLYNMQLCTSTTGGTNPLTTDAFIAPSCQLCGYGSATLTSFGTISRIGLPRWSLCPWNYQNGCSTASFTQAMIDDAANYKITTYAMVQSTDIYSMKRLIANNHALHFTFQVDSNFYYTGTDQGIAPCDYIWNSVGTLMSSHAVSIIGYDDTKQAWLCQNSWGTTWGCNGQLWIAYNFLPVKTGGLYWMTTRIDQNNLIL